MAATLEIVIPVRNPTDVLETTARSLIRQEEKAFSVLLSDNFSTKGLEIIGRSAGILRDAGLAVRVVKPPEELGRVEHWNWSHRQAAADWIKPLFVGDWLEPIYVSRVLQAIGEHPNVEIVNCSFMSHQPDGSQAQTLYRGGVRSPEEVLADACRDGNCFGGPINVCFRKLAFDIIGGYPPALPVSADFWVILQLALRKGLVTCPEILAHFNCHATRFSTNFPWTRIHGDRELFIILLAATSTANFTQIPVKLSVRNRFFARLFKRNTRSWIARRFSQTKPA
jgi:glycosyltransferase involved in cell wall biosynthesis